MPSLVEEPRMGTPRSLWDVDIFIKGCEGLPRMDYVGHADPYVKLRITTPDGTQTFDYKTSVIYNTGQPIFDEEIRLHNVPVGAQCNFQIWDKDHLTHDDHIGCCEVVLDNDTLAVAARSAQTGSRGAAPPWPSGPGAGGCQLRLPIRAAPGLAMSTAGVLLLALRCRATCQPPGPMLHCGPVRYRRTESRLAGAISGLNEDGCYAAYKLSLAGLPAFFPDGAAIHWNTSYDKARQIFGSSAITNAVRAQHAVLYQDKGRQGSRGVLRGGGDLVSLLRGGVRAQQRRYYTYVLTADGSWCFSETGAAFFADFVSKHAMHAGCAEHVGRTRARTRARPGTAAPSSPMRIPVALFSAALLRYRMFAPPGCPAELPGCRAGAPGSLDLLLHKCAFYPSRQEHVMPPPLCGPRWFVRASSAYCRGSCWRGPLMTPRPTRWRPRRWTPPSRRRRWTACTATRRAVGRC
ncbi:hypothetical protein PLESTB_001009600 [Pleodorina starrii]|uniref:C2 domain-containing protein n=1 Tax=Pleodorina starrii TaxID=330485 RepID=A0A9W6BPB4_9CHLO|nr:hypothetical protein PLESTB_001009600 [Pleodorina starrii]